MYLNTNAFIAQIGSKPHQPVKHFTLRRKPKSAALRAELLHKCKHLLFFFIFSIISFDKIFCFSFRISIANEVATSAKKNSTTPAAAARYRGSKELNDNSEFIYGYKPIIYMYNLLYKSAII